MNDINHPRVLPDMWRAEAKMISDLADRPEGSDAAAAAFRARATCLEQCSQELENRLLWSGLE